MTSIGLALRLGFTSVCCLCRYIVRRPNEFAILVWGSILGRSRLMFLAAIVKFCWIAAFLIASRAFAVSSSTGCSHNSHAFGTSVAKWHYSIHLINCSRVQSREEVITFFCRAMDCSISFFFPNGCIPNGVFQMVYSKWCIFGTISVPFHILGYFSVLHGNTRCI